ncbi:nitroreductase family protein [Gemmatimonadota bacterium]
MNDLIEVICSRHSVRAFSKHAIDKGSVIKIVLAGLAAPSSNAVRPWEIIVIDNPDLLKRLSTTHIYSSFVASASQCFVVCGDHTRTKYWVEDCSAVVENMLLAAHALGLGACWVAVHRQKHGHENAESYVRSVLQIPDTLSVLAMVPVGKLLSATPRVSRKSNSDRVYLNNYGNRGFDTY